MLLVRATAVLACLGLLSATSVCASEGAPPSARCKAHRGERVVLRTVTGVVTDRYRTHPQPGLAEATHTDAYYGCLDRTGRRIFLGGVVESQNGGNGGRLDGFELSGPYVTFVYTFGSKYGTADTRVEQYD